MATNGLTTTANYSCVAGYTMSGDNFRICRTDGAWLPVTPTCVQCATIGIPSSGDVITTSDGFTSTATYTCMSGYTLIGYNKRTCLIDGTWTGVTPICECEAPFTPSNGVTVADGTNADYTCNEHYSLLGPSSRTCNNDGTGWSDTDPSCTPCPTLAIPSGGAYTTGTTGTQTFALFTCDVGYSLQGVYKVYCFSSGTWDTLPTCVECETVVPPDSGTVDISTSSRITMATYSCASGYNMNGALDRLCLSDGTYEGSSPTCSCKSPMAPQNGQVTDDGYQATYTCNVGYSLGGAVSRDCQTDGTGWAGSDPVCNPCETLFTPIGGSVSFTTDNLETQASYTCDVGYTLNGQQSIACRSDGSWDFSQPQCALCETLTTPFSGNITLSTNSLTTSASFICVSGYYISGSLTSVCKADGTWTNNPPTCKCNSPSAPTHGILSITETGGGQVANYLCELGYSISGLASRLCRTDGNSWEDIDPTCNLCTTITTTPELNVDIATNGTTTTAVYACALNYTLSGEHSHTCISDGTWNFQMPTCEQCLLKYAPLSGSVHLSTDGLETVAAFSCVTGYNLNSTSVVTCQSDGTWNLPDPFCICDPPPAIIDGGMDLQAGGMLANFSCDTGYELVGSFMRFCRTDGTGWNGTQPRCDYIEPTTPEMAASQDGTYLAISSAALIALVVIVILLIIILVVMSICCYLRYRKEKYKVGATFDSSDNRPLDQETHFHLDSPELENGKALLIKETDKKSIFNVNSLRKKPSESSVEMKKKDTPVVKKEKEAVAKTPMTKSKQNGQVSQTLPLSSVRLPKLPPKPPDGHRITNKPKRKRRRVDKKLSATAPAGSGNKVSLSDTRTSTPIELVMNRTDTPDLLSTEQFDYLKPVFCHEASTPAPSRPTTNHENRGEPVEPGPLSGEMKTPSLVSLDKFDYLKPLYCRKTSKVVLGRSNSKHESLRESAMDDSKITSMKSLDNIDMLRPNETSTPVPMPRRSRPTSTHEKKRRMSITEGVKTPDMLSLDKFDYVKPVYCHEASTPAPSRPTTRHDSKREVIVDRSMQTESNV